MPVLNEERHLASAVRHVLEQDYPGEIEVVLAVGPSSDRTQEIADGLAAADPRVKVVPNPSGRTPSGLNAAIAASSHDIVARIDGHAMMPSDYLRIAVETLEETGADNVGGIMAAEGETPWEKAVAAAMTSKIGVGNARFHTGGESGPADTVYLGVFRRSELEAVGGFDETLERNQDYELNWRLRQKGGVVWFDPGLAVEYRPRSTPRALWRQYFDYGYWKRIVLRRHPESLRWRQLAAPALVVGLGVSAALAVFDWKKGSALPGVYVAATAGAGLVDLVRGRDPAALLEPVALWVMHIAWGSGFIAGLLSGRR